MENWRQHILKFSAVLLFMHGGGLFFLSSCTALDTIKGRPIFFQSDEYVVYQLKGGETPATLAERFLGDQKRSWVIEDSNESVAFKQNEIVVIPLKEENKGGLMADGFQAIPILCYHRFAKECDSPLCIPTRVFDRQMKYLKDNDYRVVTLGKLLGFLQYRHALPKRSVVITLDDGYRSAYDIAFPILKKYGFTATLLIYTDYVGISKNAVTWNQLREMKTEGFEVGSQTVSHCDLTKREAGEDDAAYTTRVVKELRMSKHIIDRELAQDTISLAFPYGRYNERVVATCHKVGYKIAVSVRRGSNPFFFNPLFLKRDQILARDMRTFISRLNTFHKLSLK